MFKTVLLSITFLACTAWMAAQQGNPPSSSYPSSSAGQSSGQAGSQSGAPTTGQTGSENGQTAGAPGASGHMNDNTTLRGCLNSSGGGYTLTDASGTQYQLTGDTSKLSKHVNNEVEVKGNTTSGSMGASASTGSAAGSQSATGSTAAGSSGQMFNVTKVKKISGTCNTSGTTGGTNR
jgi:Protein of unknown function (DUF5818)